MAETHQLEFAGLYFVDVGRDLVLGADNIQHLENFLIGAAVQRAGKGGASGSGREERIGLRTAHGAHGVGAAVLLVVGVQDEQDVEGPRQDGVGLVLRLHQLPQHVHEVLGDS